MNTQVKVKYKNQDPSTLNKKGTLLIGVGNSARSDDGLGWAFLDRIKALDCFEGELLYCYQLQIEDAELISRYAKVIFVDACEGKHNNGFDWNITQAVNDFTFTTHALTPAAVLFLCNDLYRKSPEAYTLKIKGEEWELKPGLSDIAEESLQKALSFFKEIIIPKKNKQMSRSMGLISNSIL